MTGMAEYIEREALIKAIENDCLELVYYTKEDAIQCVKAIPAADVAPVRHGQWERIGIRGRKGLTIYPCCSACGMVFAAYRSEWEGSRGAWKFCPNCGARMNADTQERDGGK